MDPLVGIHRDDNISRSRIRNPPGMPGFQIIQDGRLVQKTKVDHIFDFNQFSVFVDILQR